MTTSTLPSTLPMPPQPSTPTRVWLTRRQFLASGAIIPVVVAALPLHELTTAPPAAAASPTTNDTPLSSLERRYGTPTEVALTHHLQAWTREPDGTVVTLHRETRAWNAAAEQDWQRVLTYGTPTLVRWSRPSGHNELVVVFGTPPDPVTTTSSTTSTTLPPAPETTSSPAPETTIPPNPATTARPARGTPVPPARRTPEARSADLPQTGFPVARIALPAVALIAAGAGLLALRHHRARPRPATQKAPLDPGI